MDTRAIHMAAIMGVYGQWLLAFCTALWYGGIELRFGIKCNYVSCLWIVIGTTMSQCLYIPRCSKERKHATLIYAHM